MHLHQEDVEVSAVVGEAFERLVEIRFIRRPIKVD